MKYRDKQLGKPAVIFKGTKTSIQSMPSEEGMIAYATDTDQVGTYNGTTWIWYSSTGGGVDYFIDLLDTPSSFTGQAGKVVAVNSSENALEFITVSGTGGGGSLGIFDPRAAPATPHSLDDEFDDLSLSSSWTEFDPPGNLTVAETLAGLELSISQGTEQILGIYKGVPSASDFTVWTKIHILAPYNKAFKAGIFLGQDSTLTTTSDMWVFNYSIITNHYTQVERMNSYNSFYGNYLNDERPPQFNSMYMRLRIRQNVSSADVWLDTSLDGLSWFNMSYKLNGGSDDYFTTHFLPQSMGLFVKRTFSDTGLEGKAVFSFFRVYENNDMTYIPRGRRI